MRRLRWLASAAIPLVALLVAGGVDAANGHANFHAICPGPDSGSARCNALVVDDARGNPAATTAPTGLTPAQFHSAYNLPTTAPTTQTIGIVDAYDDPTAA